MAIPSRSKSKKEAPTANAFSIEDWGNSKDGNRVIIYGESGIGKSTLACTAPNPLFIGLDDGAKKLKDPTTGKHMKYIKGIETFDDVLAALKTTTLLADFDTIVIDTVTELQKLAEPYVVNNYKKDGKLVDNLEAYGYGRGYRHLVEAMRKILVACDVLIAAGKNVVFLAQLSTRKKADAGNTDYLQEGPDLFHNNQWSVRNEFVAWADHVVKIGLHDIAVDKDSKVTGGAERAIFTAPHAYYIAKLRGIPQEDISFGDVSDDSFWITIGD